MKKKKKSKKKKKNKRHYYYDYPIQPIKTALPEPVFYAELSDSDKKEVRERIYELISEFIGSNDFIPDEDDTNEILKRICDEISAGLNPPFYSDFGYFGSLGHYDEYGDYVDYYPYMPDINFRAETQEFDEEGNNSAEPDDDFDEDENEEDEEKEEPEKELLPDDNMRAIFSEALEQIIKECREDGFDPPTYLDTLVVLETERLKIRRFTLGDLNSLWAIMRKPDVMYARGRGFRKRETKKWINQQLERYRKDGYGYFAVTLKESGELIGQTGLFKADINLETVSEFSVEQETMQTYVEIGYIFNDFAGENGYCIEAAKACVEMAFNQLEIDKLYCAIEPCDEPSALVAKKLGMTLAGKCVKIFDEKEIPHLVYVLEK